MTQPNATVTNQLNKLKAEKDENGQFNANELTEGTKLQPKQLFQQYKSARVAMRLVTTRGVQIKFTNYELLTQDPEVIEYLDNEIKRRGLPTVTKGAELTLEDINPEKAMERRLREKIEKEVAAEIEAGTYGKARQFGKTEGASSLMAAHSGQAAN